MDLRVVKTKMNIRRAFLELRQTQPLEKIRVTQICKLAMINKTTFYNHYQDVYALSEELEEEVFDNFRKTLEGRDTLLTDPTQFLDDFPAQEKDKHGEQYELVYQLFHDRMEELYQKMEQCVKKYYLQKCKTPEEEIRLIFLINGIIYTGRELRLYHNYDEKMVRDIFVEIFNRLREIDFLPQLLSDKS